MWKLVLPTSGQVIVNGLAAGGALVPPQLPHDCVTTSGFVAVVLEPWCLPPRVGLALLEPSVTRRLLDALGAEWDLDALRSEVATLFGPAPTLDPRLETILRRCGDVGHLADLAHEVGLSAPRIRALARSAIGVPLGRVRQWQRLRTAVLAFPQGPISAAAARADFADQAHLTRTAQKLIGRSPGSLSVW
ncbi:helix-turn-helix domain-containing protein [Nocardia sp. NPDC004278]